MAVSLAAGFLLYLKVASMLREKIRRGEVFSGTKLAPIPDLQAEYKVARSTIRQSLAVLQGEGLVSSARGCGTIIAGARQLAPRDLPIYDSLYLPPDISFEILGRTLCDELPDIGVEIRDMPGASGPAARLSPGGVSTMADCRAAGSFAEGGVRMPVEIWFQDEARIGQKNGVVRQWARRGTRPRQPADPRYSSAYLFGARRRREHGALPYADTDAMQRHLDEIGRHVAKGAHAVLLLYRAGWHTTAKLDMPENITPIFLPSRAPELNPVENVWQYMRQNWLSNRVFETYESIIGAACEARRKLLAQPQTITSIGMRDWAHMGQSS